MARIRRRGLADLVVRLPGNRTIRSGMDASALLESSGRKLVTRDLSRNPDQGRGASTQVGWGRAQASTGPPMGLPLIQGGQKVTKFTFQDNPIPDVGYIGPWGD